jgi:hypothetical protein
MTETIKSAEDCKTLEEYIEFDLKIQHITSVDVIFHESLYFLKSLQDKKIITIKNGAEAEKLSNSIFYKIVEELKLNIDDLRFTLQPNYKKQLQLTQTNQRNEQQ